MRDLAARVTRFRNVHVFARWGADRSFRRWGERWGITSVGDIASLPLLVLLLSAALFVMIPVTNAIIRVQESEADLFGLNAARELDGFAEVSLKLSEYRKMEPGPLEERIFYDHPSGPPGSGWRYSGRRRRRSEAPGRHSAAPCPRHVLAVPDFQPGDVCAAGVARGPTPRKS